MIYEGQVVRNDDPDQMGRMKVWLPSQDGESFEIESLPWAEYAPPFFGFTVDYPAGGEATETNAHASYGLWAVPKVGATVYVFFVEGDSARRAYFASSMRLHRNRSLPRGRNFDSSGKTGPYGDAGDGKGNLNKIEPAYSNLREQFQDKVTEPEAISRGVYERQVAQAQLEKDGKEGYSKTPVTGDDYLDPQTYCWVTPGRHALIFQDDPRFSRVRLVTAEGHQVILDGANERIYVSTAKGKTWIELDQDGHAHMFGAQSLSFRAGVDINMYADRDINLEAARAIHVRATGGDIRLSTSNSLHLQAQKDGYFSVCGALHANAESSMNLTAASTLDIKSGSDMAVTGGSGLNLHGGPVVKVTGDAIHLNGPAARTANSAGCATQATSPTVVPGHEPWKRPATKGKRGKNWQA